MNICKVQGKIVSTIKNDQLAGSSFLIVRNLDQAGRVVGQPFVVVDPIGCGPGDVILVTQGSNAKYALGKDLPVDAVVIGLVDSYENK